MFWRPGERQLQERVGELQRTRRGALDVQATELRRIERDLHDGAQARLVALSMQLGRAEERLHRDPDAQALVQQARAEATAAIGELRDLARGIAPPVLADRGLAAAVQSLADRSGQSVTVNAELPERLPPAVETAAYFVVAETLTNAAKHAHATSVRVTMWAEHSELGLVVADDGVGGADQLGSGLTGLRQRVEALDGWLRVESPTGEGTTVRAGMPCGS
jgi:signal transduction histidine kinase